MLLLRYVGRRLRYSLLGALAMAATLALCGGVVHAVADNLRAIITGGLEPDWSFLQMLGLFGVYAAVSGSKWSAIIGALLGVVCGEVSRRRPDPARRLSLSILGAVRGLWVGAFIGLAGGLVINFVLRWSSLEDLPLPANFNATWWGTISGSALGALAAALANLSGYTPDELRSRLRPLEPLAKLLSLLLASRQPQQPRTAGQPLPARQPARFLSEVRNLVPQQAIPPVGFYHALLFLAATSIWNGNAGWGSPATTSNSALIAGAARELMVPAGVACLGWLCAWVRRPYDRAREKPPHPHDKPSTLLNLACFALPPLGLLVWLTLDGLRPRLARAAGRSAVRMALLVFVTCNTFILYSLVYIAIEAISKARPTPNDPVKTSARIARMRRERYQRRGLPVPQGRDNFTTEPEQNLNQYAWQKFKERPWK